MNKQLNSLSRIAAYLRKSRQTEDSDDTLHQHRATLQDFVKYHDYVDVDWFEEIASGESIEYRPVFSGLLKSVEAGHYDAVLVVHEDRLSRGDQYEQGIIHRAFKTSGTVLLTPNGTTDFSNTDQVFQTALKGLFANHELEQIKRRMTEGKKRAVKDGRPHTGRVPFPYYWDKNTKAAYIDPDKLGVYRQIIDMYVHENLSSNQIAERLNEQGVPNPSGVKNWIASSVTKMLRNRFHLGVVFHGKYKSVKVSKIDEDGNEIEYYNLRNNEDLTEYIEVEGNHEAVKTYEEHAIITELLEKRGKQFRRERRKTWFPKRLGGLVRCPHCGNVLTQYKKPDGKQYIQKCNRKSSRRIEECKTETKGVNEELLYYAVIGHLRKYKDELMTANPENESNKKHLNVLKQTILNHKKVLEKAVGNIERSKNLAVEGLISPEEFREIKEREEKNSKNANHEIKRLEKEAVIIDDVKSKRVKQKFESKEVFQLLENDEVFELGEINDILRSLIDHINYKVISKTELEVTITYN